MKFCSFVSASFNCLIWEEISSTLFLASTAIEFVVFIDVDKMFIWVWRPPSDWDLSSTGAVSVVCVWGGVPVVGIWVSVIGFVMNSFIGRIVKEKNKQTKDKNSFCKKIRKKSYYTNLPALQL